MAARRGPRARAARGHRAAARQPADPRRFADGAAAGEPLGGLAAAALVYPAATLALQGAQLGETYVAEHVGLVATNRLHADLTLARWGARRPAHWCPGFPLGSTGRGPRQ